MLFFSAAILLLCYCASNGHRHTVRLRLSLSLLHSKLAVTQANAHAADGAREHGARRGRRLVLKAHPFHFFFASAHELISSSATAPTAQAAAARNHGAPAVDARGKADVAAATSVVKRTRQEASGKQCKQHLHPTLSLSLSQCHRP